MEHLILANADATALYKPTDQTRQRTEILEKYFERIEDQSDPLVGFYVYRKKNRGTIKH